MTVWSLVECPSVLLKPLPQTTVYLNSRDGNDDDLFASNIGAELEAEYRMKQW